MYMKRFLRFPTPDPLTRKYPMLTPYQFASNCPIWMLDLDGLEGNPYNLPVSSEHYGNQNIDWGFANPSVAATADESGFIVNTKYYWDPNAWYPTGITPGAYVWQNQVTVTTTKEVEEEVWETVVEIIPAIPAGHPHYQDVHKTTEIGEIATYNNKSSEMMDFLNSSIIPPINKEKGKITGIILTVEADYPINKQIAEDLKKAYGVSVDIVISKTPIPGRTDLPNPDIQIDFNYSVKKEIPGKPGTPEKRTENLVRKTIKKQVQTTEVKQ